MNRPSYKPGMVAKVTHQGGVTETAIMSVNGWWTESGSFVHTSDASDIRPLVVLDLDEILSSVTPRDTSLRNLREGLRAGHRAMRNLADQIDAQTQPAKPEEPGVVGTVVEDRRKVAWVRVAGSGPECWHYGAVRYTWDQLVNNLGPVTVVE